MRALFRLRAGRGFRAAGAGRKVSAHGAGTGECAALRHGNEPPFSFRLRRKENGRSRSKEKALWCPQLALTGQLWTRHGVPERDRWWSVLNSALGAGLILLNLSVFSHANRNCEVGQRLKGPASLLLSRPVGLSVFPSPVFHWFLLPRSCCNMVVQRVR